MKTQITRISVLQTSKIMTALYVLCGFIYTIIGVFMLIFGSTQLKIMGLVYLFMPVIIGVFGFLFFALFAWLYNVIAKQFGGIEFELTTKE